MNVPTGTRLGLAFALILATSGTTRAGEAVTPAPAPAPKTAGAGADPAAAPPTTTEPVPNSTLKWGADIFLGYSTLSAYQPYVDGFWAGASPWNPSTVYVNWENSRGYSGKVAIGLGETFNGSEASHVQPAEAWLRAPVGPIHVTGGKYWTPFAGMEWQYESRPGVMLEWADSRYTVAVSLNPNDHTNALNSYTRVGRNLGGENTVGFSLGTGKGFSYDSPHSLGFGLDGAFTWEQWSLSGEHLYLTGDRTEHFTFSYARLEHSGPGRTTPFLAWYQWKDQGKAFGSFQSILPGLQYQVNDRVTIEGAWASTSERKVGWLQLHFTYE